MNQGAPLENLDDAVEEASGAESDSQLTFSIVIPTYNEEESIETTLDAIYEASPIPPSSLPTSPTTGLLRSSVTWSTRTSSYSGSTNRKGLPPRSSRGSM